jgi:DNA-binding LacI/PurR family transcriptional regulator
VTIPPETQELIDGFLRNFDRGMERNLLSFQLIHMNSMPRSDFESEQFILQVAPLFTSALSLPGVHAWVLPSDYETFFALHFLRERGVQVPRRISLIGFDDEKLALRFNLSSYNFKFSAIAQRTISFILNPSHILFRNTPRIECEGIVVERGSSMKAHRSEL